MATIKRLARFAVTPAPINIPIELQEWLREEIERLSLVTNGVLDVMDALNAVPRMFLAGDADDLVNLDTISTRLVNYQQGGALGEVTIDPDPIAGTITIPIDGLYRVTAYVIGIQASVVQNQSILLSIGVNAPDIIQEVASIDVATSQTSVRSLSATLSRAFVTGDVITMEMIATADMGVFEVAQTSLEITLVALPNEFTSQEVNGNMQWVPWFVI